MGSLLTFFFKKLHWIIILHSGWTFYNDYTVHQEEVRALEDKIPVLEAKIKKKKREVELIESFKRDLENSKRKVESVASQIQKAQRQLPNSMDDTQILDVFSNESALINITKVSLSPMASKDNGFYISKKYSYKGTGTFLQFLIFFERLSNRERIFNISELNVKNTTGKQKGRFQLVDMDAKLEAYMYNKNYKEESGIKEIEEKFGNKGGVK